MADLMVLLAVALLLGLALKGAIKHFRGESPCCGGTSAATTEEKKLAGPAVGSRTLAISGMHCQHCVQAVTDALNALEGVSARVDLRTGRAKVVYDRPVDDAALMQAVKKAGFEVTSVS